MDTDPVIQPVALVVPEEGGADHQDLGKKWEEANLGPFPQVQGDLHPQSLLHLVQRCGQVGSSSRLFHEYEEGGGGYSLLLLQTTNSLQSEGN